MGFKVLDLNHQVVVLDVETVDSSSLLSDKSVKSLVLLSKVVDINLKIIVLQFNIIILVAKSDVVSLKGCRLQENIIIPSISQNWSTNKWWYNEWVDCVQKAGSGKNIRGDKFVVSSH